MEYFILIIGVILGVAIMDIAVTIILLVVLIKGIKSIEHNMKLERD